MKWKLGKTQKLRNQETKTLFSTKGITPTPLPFPPTPPGLPPPPRREGPRREGSQGSPGPGFPEWARAAISNSLAAPVRLEQPFRAPRQAGAANFPSFLDIF